MLLISQLSKYFNCFLHVFINQEKFYIKYIILIGLTYYFYYCKRFSIFSTIIYNLNKTTKNNAYSNLIMRQSLLPDTDTNIPIYKSVFQPSIKSDCQRFKLFVIATGCKSVSNGTSPICPTAVC